MRSPHIVKTDVLKLLFYSFYSVFQSTVYRLFNSQFIVKYLWFRFQYFKVVFLVITFLVLEKLNHLDIGNFSNWTILKRLNLYSGKIKFLKSRASGFRMGHFLKKHLFHIIWLLNINPSLTLRTLKCLCMLLSADIFLSARNAISWKFSKVKMNTWFKKKQHFKWRWRIQGVDPWSNFNMLDW